MWTYEKMKGTSNVQGEASGCGKYYRHHKDRFLTLTLTLTLSLSLSLSLTLTQTPTPAQDCFLELGLVKAAFLWELLKLRYDVRRPWLGLG